MTGEFEVALQRLTGKGERARSRIGSGRAGRHVAEHPGRMRIAITGDAAVGWSRQCGERAIVERLHRSGRTLCQKESRFAGYWRRPLSEGSDLAGVVHLIGNPRPFVPTRFQALQILVVERQEQIAVEFWLDKIALRSDRRRGAGNKQLFLPVRPQKSVNIANDVQ